ncbi:hypothetical protein DRN73_01985 [Candidatus Pacearchaeota archaeon]|nr:MAG: hypothetical protein DRN73_01985 [Candidatus Pacearchaeota archaeon]
MYTKNQKMNAKKLIVSFFAVACMILLAATVSAAGVTNNLNVKLNDEDVSSNNLAVIAGDTVNVRVAFNSIIDSSDVTVKAEIEGDKADVSDMTPSFDVENGKRYVKTLNLEVPYELKDELSEDITLTVTVKKNGNVKTVKEYSLRVQRPSYEANVMSIVTANTVDAGENFPVDIVLKNIGYNDLSDLYVSAKISAIDGVERTVYFGDLVAIENDSKDDDSTTTNGRIFLQMPYDVESGIYTLEIEVSNDDLDLSKTKQIVVNNDFPSTVMKAGNDLLIVNPTEKLKIYKVVSPTSESFVTVPAGESKTVEVSPDSEDYTVNVLTMSGELVGSFTFQSVEEEKSVTSPIVVLTVILAIIFLVLLVVLIVLIGKKPEKAEEFGESYY